MFQEHDHEAEQLISTLSINPEDDELDVGKCNLFINLVNNLVLFCFINF